MQARSFWIEAPGEGRIREEPLPAPGPGEVRVRTLYSGVSRGTESLVFRGEIPSSVAEAMRAPFQRGDFPGPVCYGYMNVGRVEHGPPDLLGQTVFCLHPHQDHYVVPANAVRPVPAAVPPARAILAANLETAINGVWDAGVGPGDRVTVIGAGVVGSLVAWLCARIPGTETTLVDPLPERRIVAEALGARFSGLDTVPDEADRVFHTSGHPDGLRRALAAAGAEAVITELSWYGTQEVPLPLGAAFHPRRLTLRSSQVGGLPPERRPRWTLARRMDLALRLLDAPELDAVITGETPFHELPECMPALARGDGGPLCHRIRYPETD